LQEDAPRLKPSDLSKNDRTAIESAVAENVFPAKKHFELATDLLDDGVMGSMFDMLGMGSTAPEHRIKRLMYWGAITACIKSKMGSLRSAAVKAIKLACLGKGMGMDTAVRRQWVSCHCLLAGGYLC
jgi:hypothetical protein